MKNIINDITKHTPMYLDGYYYIKTQKIYIPFSNLTIHGIEKDIISLDPFFESVMTLADEGITNLESIAEILGLFDDVFNEAVMDMAHTDYISVSAGKINLTKKGKIALKENKRVERKNIDLQNIFADLITGKVYDAGDVYINPKGRYIPLEPVVNIDEKYFSENFKEIKGLHKLRQKQYQINENVPINKELEKITGFDQSIVYSEKELYIYKSIGSDELMFKLNGDDVEGSYLTQFFKQFNQELINGNKQFFFDMDGRINERSSCFAPDPELLKQTENIREIVLSSSPDDEKEGAILQKHYALNDREYVSYITNSSRYFKCDYIIVVCSNHIDALFSESFCSQLKSLSEDIPVFIVYDGKNEHIKKSIDHFFKDKECGKNLYLFSEANINNLFVERRGCICYYPKMVVNTMKYTANTEFKCGDLFRRIAYSVQIYDFDKKAVESIAEKIIEICPKIKECLEEISSKKTVVQNNIGKNFKSSNSSKPNKTRASYGKKHPQHTKRDKQ